MNIAVIIPALNEAVDIAAAIRSAAGAQIVVADGGSTDDTARIAAASGARVIVETGGRGRQANAGAAAASDEALLFLHADSRLPADWHRAVCGALARSHCALGAFSLAIGGARPAERIIAAGANLRSRHLALPYGDQALFMRREIFDALGGFRALPIMEDYDLVRRARAHGSIVTLPQRVVTSPRRWRQVGAARSVVLNQFMLAGWALGIPPQRLAAFYRRAR